MTLRRTVVPAPTAPVASLAGDERDPNTLPDRVASLAALAIGALGALASAAALV